MPANQQQPPSHEAIAIRAFELWTQDGQPMGNSERHWLQAEAELKNGGGAKSSSSAGRRAKRAATRA